MDNSDWDTLMSGSDPSGGLLPEYPAAHGLTEVEYNNAGRNLDADTPQGWNGIPYSNTHEGMYRPQISLQDCIYRLPVDEGFEGGQANPATGHSAGTTSSHSMGLTQYESMNYGHYDPGLPGLVMTFEQVVADRPPVFLHLPSHSNFGQASGHQMDQGYESHMSFAPLDFPMWVDSGIDSTDAADQVSAAQGGIPISSTSEGPRIHCEIQVCHSRNGPQKKKRSRATRMDWEGWKEYLKNLYETENHTAPEISFEMAVIHGFEASPSTYQNHFKDWTFRKYEVTAAGSRHNSVEPPRPTAPRRRNAAALPQSIVSSPLFRLILRRNSPIFRIPAITEEPYVHQHRMFHALDGLVKGLFAAKTNRWTCNSFTFLPPDGEPENSRGWKLLSDKCSGIAKVSVAMIGPVSGFLFKQVLAGLDAVTKSRDPSFLVHFWKMCLELSGIRLRTRARFQEFVFLRAFLRCLRYMFSRKFRECDQLVVVVDSLNQILDRSPKDLKTSLGLGCWKVTHILGDMIGADHAIVLGLGVYCTKQWNAKFTVDLESLAPRYESLLEQTGAYCSLPQPDLKISVLYDYTYALLKAKYNSEATRERATQLWNLSADVCRRRAAQGSLQYTLTTRAFAFAADVLAVHELETWNRKYKEHYHCREASFGFMNDAIETLKHGDLDCQVTAAHFSKRLALWLKSYCPGPKVDKKRLQAAQEANRGRKCRSAGRVKGERSLAEKQRTAEILAKICQMSACAVRGNPGDSSQKMSKNNRWRRQKRARRDLLVTQIVTEDQSGDTCTWSDLS